MACRDSFPLFARLLHDYDDRNFIKSNGQLDLTTNVTLITNACLEEGLVLNGEKQTVAGFTLYPKDWFCPKDHDTGRIELTENSHTIHHFDGSWLPRGLTLYQQEKASFTSRFGWLPLGVLKGAALASSCVKDGSLEPYRAWRERRSHE